MPTTYAHYRFGAEMLRSMPADVRGTAKRHRQLFDVGLHGPDLFFFYRPVFPGKVRRLGRKFHLQTGREFFSRACRNLRPEPSEGGQAYLYGVLCHYTLDALCHPLVVQADREGTARHMQIETELDRFLMERDGIRETHLAATMTLSDQACETVARFYPGADQRIIRESVRSMAKIRGILEMRSEPARRTLHKALAAGSETFRDMIPRESPDPQCALWNEPLWERYRQAAEAFPDMLLRLTALLTYNAPLGEKFDPVFG